MVKAARSGAVLSGVVLVAIFIVVLLSAGLYTRERTQAANFARLHAEVAARLAAESTIELLALQGGTATLKNWALVDLQGARGAYLLGDEVATGAGRCRQGVVWGQSSRLTRTLFVTVLTDAPHVFGAVPEPGRARVEQVRDISALGLGLPLAEPSRDVRLQLVDKARISAALGPPQPQPQ